MFEFEPVQEEISSIKIPELITIGSKQIKK